MTLIEVVIFACWAAGSAAFDCAGGQCAATESVLLQSRTGKESFELQEMSGDMCAHPSWGMCKVCRNPDGRVNNNGACSPPRYWDEGNDPSKPVNVGCRPSEVNACYGKPTGEGCRPPSDKYEEAFYAVNYKPPGKNTTCTPMCVNRKKRQLFKKAICGTLGMWSYLKGLKSQNPRCKKPRRNCHYNDHTRKKFYAQAGFGRKCRVSFDPKIFDRCANNPGDNKDCEVWKRGKKWNVLRTCWDGVWQKLCAPTSKHKCFVLHNKDDKSKKCITTCKSYGMDPGADCTAAYLAGGCPTPAPTAPPSPRSGGGGRGRGRRGRRGRGRRR